MQDVVIALTSVVMIDIFSDLLTEKIHALETHNEQTKEQMTCSARKQVDDQTGLAEAS